MKKIIFSIITFLICYNLFGSQFNYSSGSLSVLCVGSAPYYCSKTDRSMMPISLINPPNINSPFINDFGNLEIRVSNWNTLTSFGVTNANFFPEAADTVPQIGGYDSLACSGTGGYRFYTQVQGGYPSNLGGVIVPFEICPSTNTVVKIAGLSGGNSGLFTSGYLDFSNPSFDYADPSVLYYQSGSGLYSYCFPDASLSDPNCPNGQDHTTLIYDFSNCPNLIYPVPEVGGAYVGTYNDNTGRYIESASSIGQNSWGLIFRYDTQTGNCLWFSPGSFTFGGTNQVATHLNGGGLGDPTSQVGLLSAPTVTAVTGTGTLPSGTYYIKWVANGQVDGGGNFSPLNNNGGQSAGSNETTITLSSVGELNVTPPSCFNENSLWCNSSSYQPYWLLFAGTSSGKETLQDGQLLGTGNGTNTVTGTLTTNISSFANYDRIIITAGNQILFDNGIGNLCQVNLQTGVGTCPGTIVYNAGAVDAIFANNVPNGTPVYIEWWYPPLTQETISSPLVTNTPNPQTFSTAGTGLHYANMNKSGRYIWFGGEGSNVNANSIYWDTINNTISGGTIYDGTTGHVAQGYNNQVSVACIDPAVPCSVDLDMSPINNPSSYTTILSPPPNTCSPYTPTPPCWSNNEQHISWNDVNPNDTYPFITGYSSLYGFLQPSTPLQYELFGVTPNNPATVYRFAHTRSTGLNYMGGPYDFYYGTFGGISPDGKWADLSTTWNNSLGFQLYTTPRSTLVNTGNEYVDTNENVEIDTTANCTTSATNPTWSTVINGTTVDGGCTYVMLGIHGQPFAGLDWNSGQYYQSGVYIVDTSGNLQKEIDATCTSGSTAPSGTGTSFDGGCHWSYVGPTGLTTVVNAIWTRIDTFVVRLR